MRRDIEIHINTGDVTISSHNQPKLRQFRWVDNPSGLARYIYGEIDIPNIVPEYKVRENGFAFEIPYTPKNKEFMIRVRRVSDDGTFKYLTNQTDGSDWFVVKAGKWGREKKNVVACQLMEVSEDALFGVVNEGEVDIYSASESDFNIIEANTQNANCLLACVPTNNYRYPLTGVGLVRWVNSNSSNSSQLAETIQREFNEDGVIVNTALYDFVSQQMQLDTNSID